MRATAIGAACLAALAGLLVTAGGAAAHARLSTSTPAVGEVLAASPAEVSITFTEDVQKIMGTYGIDVIDESGANVTAADAALSDSDRRVLTVALTANLPVGRYVVEYKNVSDSDGDAFEGSYAFYVGREPTSAERAADAELGSAPEEEATPTAAATTSAPTTKAPTAGVPTTSGVTAVASPSAQPSDDDDSGGDLTMILVVSAIVLVAVLVVAGFVAFSRRESR